MQNHFTKLIVAEGEQIWYRLRGEEQILIERKEVLLLSGLLLKIVNVDLPELNNNTIVPTALRGMVSAAEELLARI